VSNFATANYKFIMKKIKLLSMIALFFMSAASFAQGVTTSAISGRVSEPSGALSRNRF